MIFFFIVLIYCVFDYNYKQYASATSWISSSNPSLNSTWLGVASDTSGENLAAVSLNGIYLSTSAGDTWFKAFNGSFSNIATDSTGQYLVATNTKLGIYFSNSFGTNWQLFPNTIEKKYTAIASDSTGQYLITAAFDDGIYISSNSGSNWTISSVAINVTSLASNSNSQVIIASATNYLTITTNGGVSWFTPSGFASSLKLKNVASDSSGKYLVCTEINIGNIYLSTNYGSSFIKSSAPTSLQWYSLASDSTGQYLTAGANFQSIYISINYGKTWLLTSGSNLNIPWTSIASNSEGNMLVAASYGYGIYLFDYPSASSDTNGG
jgi:hypothetical protein